MCAHFFVVSPDATTVITPDNYRQLVWPLPAGELLYVGRATGRKLAARAIRTIGDLARRDAGLMRLLLGVWGETLWTFANGLDASPVRRSGDEGIIKSVGNSTTAIRDLTSSEDVKLIIHVLAESVAARLRQHGLKCTTVALSVRDTELFSCDRQGKIPEPTYISGDIAAKALDLFAASHCPDKPIRSLGVCGGGLVLAGGHTQLDLFDADKTRYDALEKCIDALRGRFGHYSVQRCAMLQDRRLTGFNPKDDHVIHPVSFFKQELTT